MIGYTNIYIDIDIDIDISSQVIEIPDPKA